MAEAGVNITASEQSNTLAWVVSHPESEVQVAVDALDRAVGVISMSHRPQLSVGGRIATIDEFVVTSSLRRHGIGTELLEKALSRAKMLGCKRVEIGAPPETGSRGYFQKRGFTPEGKHVLSWRNVDAK
jgi:GNAT superfamily N-acetyltransferase